jgi:hypothetical protein
MVSGATVDLTDAVVMLGFDPRTRQLCRIYAKKMDPRGQTRE